MLTVEELTWPFIGLSPEDLAHGNIPDMVSWLPLSIVLSIIGERPMNGQVSSSTVGIALRI